MTILAVDLASRMSAVILLDPVPTAGSLHGEVIDQFDSWSSPALAFAAEIARCAAQADVDWVVIEDVPYGISSQKMTKPVTRLQGVLISKLANVNMLERTVFLDPARWQRELDIYGKEGKKRAHHLATSFDYHAPDTLELHRPDWDDDRLTGRQKSSIKADLRKLQTDYDDAFLIAKWTAMQTDLRAVQGVQEPSI